MISARRFFTVVASALTAVALTLSPAAAFPAAAPSGVDVSSHQHPGLTPINWSEVKTDGQSYAFIKATEGDGYINPHFIPDATAAKLAGLKVGAYHYARPAFDPVTQAAEFAAQLALVPGQSLPPVLDLEVNEGKSPLELIAWTRIFMAELEHLTGRRPMLYTYRYFWNEQMANTTQFSEYPLWLAAYQSQAPDPVGGWDKLAFWQRSSDARVAGITGPVDVNLFNGTEAQLESFSAGNLIDFGGIIDELVVPGVDLGDSAAPLIGGILALAAGVAAVPVVVKLAEDAGIHTGAGEFIAQAQELIANGSVTEDELRKMAGTNASVGDLVIMLDNARHIYGQAMVAADKINGGEVTEGLGTLTSLEGNARSIVSRALSFV